MAAGNLLKIEYQGKEYKFKVMKTLSNETADIYMVEASNGRVLFQNNWPAVRQITGRWEEVDWKCTVGRPANKEIERKLLEAVKVWAVKQVHKR